MANDTYVWHDNDFLADFCLQTLCINKAVTELGSPHQINERCLDLQDARAKQQKENKVLCVY